MALMQLVVEIQLFNVFCSIRYLNYNYYIMFVMNNKVKNTLNFMRKLMILPMLMFFYACSTDSVDFEQDQFENALTTMSVDSEAIPNKSATTIKPCYKGLSSHVSVDVSGGFGNPVVVFKAVISSSVPSNFSFKLKAEIQPLSDCDDMDSNSGTSALFGTNATFSAGSVNPASVSVLPSQLPSCYKWRLVYEGYTTGFAKPDCITYTSWQEAPLF